MLIDLPAEILTIIFDYSDDAALLQISFVCRRLALLASANAVWSKRAQRNYRMDRRIQYNNNSVSPHLVSFAS